MDLYWHARAIADLVHIRDTIGSDDPWAAQRIARRLPEAAERLRETPEMGRPGRVPGIRERFVTGTPFLLPYRVRDGAIEVLRVLHAARKWPEDIES